MPPVLKTSIRTLPSGSLPSTFVACGFQLCVSHDQRLRLQGLHDLVSNFINRMQASWSLDGHVEISEVPVCGGNSLDLRGARVMMASHLPRSENMTICINFFRDSHPFIKSSLLVSDP